MNPLVKTFIFGVTLALGTLAQAHPVSYKGATSVMMWNQPGTNDLMTTYSLTNNFALAGRYIRMNTLDGEMYVYMPQLDFLVKRWNEQTRQSNIYVFGGYGGENFLNESGVAGIGGIEADTESRFNYLSARYETILPSLGQRIHQYQLRAGVAAYPSEFEELATWLIVAFQYQPQLSAGVTVTPLVRFFYKNVLWELGSSLKGEWMFNFMIHL
jgi:hypothetical protein